MKQMRTFVIIFFVTCVFFTDLAYAQTDKNAIPSWGLGPFERDEAAYKIGPNPESEFKCPIKGTEVNWEEKSILCASANVKEEKVFLLYRAEDNSRKPSWGTSRIGLAVSDDGVNFDRHPIPVLYPDNDFMLKYEWPGGCQDPRIVKTEDGRYIITYTAWDGKVARLCIAESKDMYKWEKKGLAFNAFKNGKYNDMWTKAGAIICRQENDEFVATKINGKYWMYFGEYGLMLANSDDLINWNILENAQGVPLIVLPTRPKKWDSTVTESGALALLTKDGIHMIYNGGTDQGEKYFGLEGTVWAMGQVLFSKEDPSKVIARTEDDFFRPEKEYEINYVGESGGGNTNVTFIEGLIWFNNEWRFYYGCADSYVATAVYNPHEKEKSTYNKPNPLTMDALEKKKINGVIAKEVNDFVYGNYEGKFEPMPPHADINPQKAVIVKWENNPNRLVFSHDASYMPWLELPSGAGLQPQFWEGNMGWGELMNPSGRKERNSFVDVIENGPERVWVRWTYFGVNVGENTPPAFRATEDWVAYPNGLIWRSQSYESLMPDTLIGYCTDPIELIGLLPVGKHWKDILRKDPKVGDYHAACLLDAFSDKRYDLYWTPKQGDQIWDATYRREGDAEVWKELNNSKGVAQVMPVIDGMLFTAFGDASGFPAEETRLLENTYLDCYGWGWGSMMWDFWPIGWRNTQGGHPTEETIKLYPSCFCTLGCRLVKPGRHDVPPSDQTALEVYKQDIADMEFNRSTARRVVYSLVGVGKDMESVRTVTRQWLSKGDFCTNPESIADLQIEMIK